MNLTPLSPDGQGNYPLPYEVDELIPFLQNPTVVEVLDVSLDALIVLDMELGSQAVHEFSHSNEDVLVLASYVAGFYLRIKRPENFDAIMSQTGIPPRRVQGA
jgi:hypothetical protein